MDQPHQIDSFKFLPRLIATFYKMTELEPQFPIPWTPLVKPIEESKFALITSGGLYDSGVDSAFDVEREIQEPTWGDPSYRRIPVDIESDQISASHLHINTKNVLEDVNILLPIHRFDELVEDGHIGGLGRYAYSFMGYQGFPPDTNEWETTYGPRLAAELKAEQVSCVLLTPA